MKIINIGILAHVDAGKTTLTESLLYASGAISEPGSVYMGKNSNIDYFHVIVLPLLPRRAKNPQQ